MRIELEDFGTGWYQLHVALKEQDIDSLVAQLLMLKDNKDQHFHASSDYEGEGGIGDIEFYVQSADEQDNLMITGPSVSPTR